MQRAYLYLILTNLLWSGNFIIGRATHASIGPLTLSASRWLLVSFLLLPFAFRAVVKLGFDYHQWFKLAIMALIGVSFYNTFIYIGLQYTAAPNAVIFNSSIAFYIILFNWIIYQRHPGAKELIGIILSTSGVIYLVSNGFNFSEFSFGKGDSWIIFATLSWGLYTALLPSWRPQQLTGIEFLAILAGLGAMPILLARIINPFAEPAFVFNLENLTAVTYVAVAASILAWLCFNEGVKLIGSEKAGQSIHMMPVFVTIMAFIFLSEQLTLTDLIGATLIFAGLLTANKLSLFKAKTNKAKD